jgi:hypothetical protein
MGVFHQVDDFDLVPPWQMFCADLFKSAERGGRARGRAGDIKLQPVVTGWRPRRRSL